MATMVERMHSVLVPPPPTIPQRRPITEIIDVDSLDSDDEQTARRVRSRREPPVEVIEVSDDEDEGVVQVAGSSRNTGGPVHVSARNLSRNFNRIFSPPPQLNLTPTPIPPVPRLPPHLVAHASLPMRRHPPPQHNIGSGSSSSTTVQPPVRAHDQPFDFEDAFRTGSSGTGRASQSGQSSPARASGSRAASRTSSPIAAPPRLGLGGALISDNNARVAEERHLASRRRASAFERAREHARNRTMRAVARTNGNWDRDVGFGFGGFGANRDQALAHLYLEVGLMPMEWPPGFHDPCPYQLKNPEIEYQKEFTHPKCAEAGFTFDFAAGASEDGEINPAKGSHFPVTSAENPIIIDDDEEEEKAVSARSSSGGGGEVAVEASSLSPLPLKTILVCCHCRDPLLLGESASKFGPEGEKAKRIWSLRCGHMIDGKCLDVLSIPSSTSASSASEQAGSSSDADRKGKGKAVAPPEAESELETSDYRSRLRSGRSYMSSLSSLLSGRRRDVKEKENKDLNAVEETFEWECPVSSCKKLHTSVKIRGVWGPVKPEMNKGDGVIGVFV